MSDVPLQDAPDAAVERLSFPSFSEGGGHATELLLLNPTREAAAGHLRIRDDSGKVLATILR